MARRSKQSKHLHAARLKLFARRAASSPRAPLDELASTAETGAVLVNPLPDTVVNESEVEEALQCDDADVADAAHAADAVDEADADWVEEPGEAPSVEVSSPRHGSTDRRSKRRKAPRTQPSPPRMAKTKSSPTAKTPRRLSKKAADARSRRALRMKKYRAAKRARSSSGGKREASGHARNPPQRTSPAHLLLLLTVDAVRSPSPPKKRPRPHLPG